ncbi:MAG: hypothetical protein HY302_03415 [Opitutae bacterium]|nr:hypothetical protein [Opitutae bacterium]
MREGKLVAANHAKASAQNCARPVGAYGLRIGGWREIVEPELERSARSAALQCSMNSVCGGKERGELIGPAFARSWMAFWGFSAVLVETAPMMAEQMHGLLTNALRQAGFSPGILRPFGNFDDARYYLPTRENLDQLLATKGPTAGYGSVVDLFDCDDFAYNFRGFAAAHRFRSRDRGDNTTPFAIGLLWGAGFTGLGPDSHLLNVAVLSDHSVWLVDTWPEGIRLAELKPDVAASLAYLVI